jgi:hypothetical protein
MKTNHVLITFGRSVLDSARCHSTNAAYGVSDVTLHVDVKSGIGQIKLQVEEAATLIQQSLANQY